MVCDETIHLVSVHDRVRRARSACHDSVTILLSQVPFPGSARILVLVLAAFFIFHFVTVVLLEIHVSC